MIVVDVNILIYAYNAGAPQHRVARQWVENAFTGGEHIGLPWAVAHAFLRLTTDGPSMTKPFSIEEASAIVEDWLGAPAVTMLSPGVRYWPILRDLIIGNGLRGSLISDAHIAALAIEHDASVCTTDRDFRRFANVRVINPLTS